MACNRFWTAWPTRRTINTDRCSSTGRRAEARALAPDRTASPALGPTPLSAPSPPPRAQGSGLGSRTGPGRGGAVLCLGAENPPQAREWGWVWVWVGPGTGVGEGCPLPIPWPTWAPGGAEPLHTRRQDDVALASGGRAGGPPSSADPLPPLGREPERFL